MAYPFKRIAVKREIKRLKEPQALPMGRQEFEVWSDRIISIAQIPGATAESQKYTLANMLMHVKPTEAFVDDAYFANSLRKFAVNQVADVIRKEIHERVKARLAEEEKQKSLPEASNLGEQKILEHGKVQEA